MNSHHDKQSKLGCYNCKDAKKENLGKKACCPFGNISTYVNGSCAVKSQLLVGQNMTAAYQGKKIYR